MKTEPGPESLEIEEQKVEVSSESDVAEPIEVPSPDPPKLPEIKKPIEEEKKPEPVKPLKEEVKIENLNNADLNSFVFITESEFQGKFSESYYHTKFSELERYPSVEEAVSDL